jgi:hypothetical protein
VSPFWHPSPADPKKKGEGGGEEEEWIAERNKFFYNGLARSDVLMIKEFLR